MLVLDKVQAFEKYPNGKGKFIQTVVIDPGHGGHDSGCHGSNSFEKHVALSVSLKLGKLINQFFPDVKVIYTRKTDVFVELHRRAQIANENKADLFICIHCNSGPKTAFGSETFVMGLHKSTENLNVAQRENAVILKEDNYEKKYDGFDPNSDEAHIIFSLYQNAFLSQSLYFADKVQQEFTHYAGRNNRGVKQAGFLVLYRTTMPAVLIETGFLTNSTEEKYLASESGQNQISTAILRAFQSYKSWVEGQAPPDKPIIPASPEMPRESSVVLQNSDDNKELVSETKQNESEVNQAIVFKIQLSSSSEKISLNSPLFKGLPDVSFYEHNRTYKYTCGMFSTLEDAVKLQAELKQGKFPDAFIIAFKNNQRISLQEAQAIQP